MNELLIKLKYNRLSPIERYFANLFDEVELFEVKYGMYQYIYSGGFAFTVNGDILVISSNIIYDMTMFVEKPNIIDNKELVMQYFNKLFNLNITKVMTSYGR